LLADPPAFEVRQAPVVEPKKSVTDEVDDLFDSFLDDAFAAPELDQAAPQPNLQGQDAGFVAVTPDEAVLAEAAPEAQPEPEPETEPE
ncbi:hypothetical protein FPK55_25590, partial [Acinetobacter baumannii]|nr:hypothetical protein [Acinetobacter baumannii]